MSYYTRLELQWDDADYKSLSRPGEQGSDPRRLDAGQQQTYRPQLQ
jgi:hypothetical protein|uniref:Uncharacterized protein n=1 Tax=Variovorax paradoxus (strain S110) TaxID=543728 RepID=C5CKZ8_VARPS